MTAPAPVSKVFALPFRTHRMEYQTDVIAADGRLIQWFAGEERDEIADALCRAVNAYDVMLEALRSIHAGSSITGRWLCDGEALDGFTDEDDEPPADEFPGAQWEPYTAEEQAS